NRLAQGVGQELIAGDRNRDGLALDLRRPPGVVAEVVDDERDVGDAGDRERLPVVEGLELRELFGMFLDEVGELPDRAATLGWRHPLPPHSGLERTTGGADGAVDVILLAGG